MKIDRAVPLLAALAHAHRLALFRKLVAAGPEGLAAGVLAARLGVAPGTLSFHLKALANAGLIKPHPDRQFIYYCANFELMNQLLDHLTRNCCGGRDCEIAPWTRPSTSSSSAPATPRAASSPKRR